MDYTATPCRLGWLLVARDGSGVCAVLLADSKQQLISELKQRFPSVLPVENKPALSNELVTIRKMIEQPAQSAHIQLSMHGTPFQQQVWQALRMIPPGVTITYSELAARIGNPGAVRAVARACAANPLAVLVPCHRVIGKNGRLTGYRWGLARKKALLAHEAASHTQAET